MTTLHESFEETYNYLSSFYGLIKNDSNFSELEVLQLNKLSSFYFNFQDKLRKTIEFDIKIDFDNKNQDFFIINDILKISSGHITNTIIFDYKEDPLQSLLDISGYVAWSKPSKKVLETSCKFTIDNIYKFFIVEKKESDDYGILDYSNEIISNLEKHFNSVLKNHQSEIENAFPIFNDTNIFFNELLNSTSTYESTTSRITRDVIFKTTIDFSSITSTHFSKKQYTKDEYKKTIKEFADTLMLLHDVSISDKTKKTIFFKEKLKNRAPK